MWVEGHKKILENAIENFELDDLKSFYDINQQLILNKGLKFCDHPASCCYYDTHKKNDINSIDCVKVHNPISYVFAMTNQLSLAFDSHAHKGIWKHSLVTNSNQSVWDTRNYICERILALYLYAVNLYKKGDKEQAIFWLGCLLHAIQDSYSPAHTKRMKFKDEDNEHDSFDHFMKKKPLEKGFLKLNFKSDFVVEPKLKRAEKFKTVENFTNFLLKKKVDPLDFKHKKLEYFYEYDKYYKFPNQKLKAKLEKSDQLETLYSEYYFENKILHNLHSKWKRNASDQDSTLEKKPFIVMFYWVDRQPSLMVHHKYDDLEVVDKMGLLTHVVDDTKRILENFYYHVTNNLSDIMILQSMEKLIFDDIFYVPIITKNFSAGVPVYFEIEKNDPLNPFLDVQNPKTILPITENEWIGYKQEMDKNLGNFWLVIVLGVSLFIIFIALIVVFCKLNRLPKTFLTKK